MWSNPVWSAEPVAVKLEGAESVVSVEDEVVSSVDEDESAFVSVRLSTHSPQEESKNAVQKQGVWYDVKLTKHYFKSLEQVKGKLNKCDN